jgi:uracil-DNA glycosylase family 4
LIPEKLTMARPTGKPGRDCPRCPRLAAFREDWRGREPTWFNAPVPSFGPVDARLLVVGLAPGLRGANRTGRPFTGDYAGELLYATLKEYGFARGSFEARIDDTLELIDCRITNGVRCVPPENKPTPLEINTCRDFLTPTIAEMPNLRAIVALGRIAHETAVKALGARRAQAAFSHGGCAAIGPLTLFSSYHCSRYNTNTGVLTPEMFRAVFAAVRAHLDGLGKTFAPKGRSQRAPSRRQRG